MFIEIYLLFYIYEIIMCCYVFQYFVFPILDFWTTTISVKLNPEHLMV